MSVIRTAIITGSARGLGRGIALRLAADGYNVTVSDLASMKAEAEDTASKISAMGRRSNVALGDVSSRKDVKAIVESHVDQITEEDFQQMFNVNVGGVFNSYQVAAKQLIKQGTEGKLIGAASVASFKPFPLLAHYSASKFAVRGLTQAFAMEMAPHKIRVNAYSPGMSRTSMYDMMSESLSAIDGSPKGESMKRFTDAHIALKRPGEVEDVAKLVSFLVSEESDYITGQTINVDGGIVFT